MHQPREEIPIGTTSYSLNLSCVVYFVYFHFLLVVFALVQWSTLWKQQPNSPWLVYDEIYVWYIATLPIGPNDMVDDEIKAMDERAIDTGASAKLSSWKMLSTADVWSCRQSAAENAPEARLPAAGLGYFLLSYWTKIWHSFLIGWQALEPDFTSLP